MYKEKIGVNLLFALRPLDFGVFIIAAAVMIASAFFVYGRSQENIVISCLDNTWIFPLDEKREVRVPGPLGETTIIIEKSRAYVANSPCENKLCLTAPSVGTGGQWIACLPNRVMITVESIKAGGNKQNEDVDAATW